MSLKRFNAIFGVDTTIAQARADFIQRINQTVFKGLYKSKTDMFTKPLFKHLCYEFGVDPDPLISRASSMAFDSIIIPPITQLTDNDFIKTLQTLVLLYEYFKDDERLQTFVDYQIERALDISPIDIGIRWKDGMFYPSGAKELDKDLIEEPYDWLEQYPESRQDLIKALENYTNKSYNDVIDHCYLAMEGLARKLLNNKKTLENNVDEILKTANLSQEWKSALRIYLNYANEYKRHASEKRSAIDPNEVEAFMYFTGIMIRLLVKREIVSDAK